MARLATMLGAIAMSLSPTASGTVETDDVSASWLDLWTRCRTAIETVQALNVDGLSPVEIPANDGEYPFARDDFSHSAWMRDGDRFLIVEGEWRRHDGTVRRGCDVRLTPDAALLSEVEEALLVRAFLIERWSLIAIDIHEIRNPDPIFPISLGVGPIEENLNGCRVISTLIADSRIDFFTSGTGEQARLGCAGASFLDPGGSAAD